MTNIAQAAELLLENYNTVGVIFANPEGRFYEMPVTSLASEHTIINDGLGQVLPSNMPKVYTYKIPKDLKVSVNDLMLCRVNNTVKIVKVARIDAEPQIEFTGNVQYKWVFQIVDISQLEALESFDTKIQKSIQVLEQRKLKRDLLKELAGEMTEEEMQSLLKGELPKAIESKD